MPRRVFPVGKTPDVSQAGLEGQPFVPPAALVQISPMGGRAFAQVGSDNLHGRDPRGRWAPSGRVGGQPARVPPSKCASSPTWEGEFPAWNADGTRVSWSIGNALFTYDLAHVEAQEDTVAMVRREGALRKLAAMGGERLTARRAG